MARAGIKRNTRFVSQMTLTVISDLLVGPPISRAMVTWQAGPGLLSSSPFSSLHMAVRGFLARALASRYLFLDISIKSIMPGPWGVPEEQTAVRPGRGAWGRLFVRHRRRRSKTTLSSIRAAVHVSSCMTVFVISAMNLFSAQSLEAIVNNVRRFIPAH
jgi:hypothetical protein